VTQNDYDYPATEKISDYQLHPSFNGCNLENICGLYSCKYSKSHYFYSFKKLIRLSYKMAHVIKVTLPQSNVIKDNMGLQMPALHTCTFMGVHGIQGTTYIDVVLYPQRRGLCNPVIILLPQA
jgi:hypothetical protein